MISHRVEENQLSDLIEVLAPFTTLRCLGHADVFPGTSKDSRSPSAPPTPWTNWVTSSRCNIVIDPKSTDLLGVDGYSEGQPQAIS
jgi:hypothetical protein